MLARVPASRAARPRYGDDGGYGCEHARSALDNGRSTVGLETDDRPEYSDWCAAGDESHAGSERVVAGAIGGEDAVVDG